MVNKTGSYQKLVILIALSLVLLGGARIFQVVLHVPLIGYADQFDMRRMQNCFGIWPNPRDINVDGSLWKAPINNYKMGGLKHPEYCYQSSEKLFIWLGLVTGEIKNQWLARPPEQFELQTVGMVKAGILCLTVCCLIWLYRKRPFAALSHAAIFALVIADPYNTLWLNTLYTEFAALYFAYLSVALAHYLLTTEQSGFLVKGLFLVSLLFLGASKMQHILLPFLLGATIALGFRHKFRQEKLFVAAIIVICLSVSLIQKNSMNHAHYMQDVIAANAADTYLGAVLPAMQDPVQGIKLLGLPDKCTAYVGYTWYDQHGIDLRKECPEVFGVPRWRLLRVIAFEPALVLRMLQHALPETQDWILGLGQVEGLHYAVIDTAFPSSFTSAASLVKALPVKIYIAIFFALGIGWLYAVLKGACFVVDSSKKVPWLLLISTSMVWMIIFASIFGDGYHEVAKHSHLSFSAIHLFLLWIVMQPILWGFSKKALFA